MHKALFRVALSAALISPLAVFLPMFAQADSVSMDFENPPYTLGTINSQDSWTSTGAAGSGCQKYDHAVDNSLGTAGFGSQSLRISNATTSGCFSDQTFSKPLSNSVGETVATAGSFSVGTKQPHFEMQFAIASAQPGSEQPGLFMSVSPDRGDGSRMSYIGFQDTAAGIVVNFYDVQGTTNPATFVETKIATISRTPHIVKLTLDTIEGASNDVVKVYIDGNLVHLGTSWENYYRYDTEANAEQTPRIVKSVLFRTGGGDGLTNPGVLGKGYLVDNITLLSGAAPAAPVNNTVVVHHSDLAANLADVISTPTKWFFYNDENDTIDNTLGSFVTGPSTPPLGIGSAQISVTGTERRNLATYQFSGVKLGDITTLKFSTYNPSAGNGGAVNRAAYLNFNVDFNGSDTWQKRLAFVPNQNGSVVQNSWQEWDAIQSGNALYSYSGATWPDTATGPDAGLVGVPGTTLRSWNSLIADYPGIRIRVTDSWLGLRVGEPYADGYTENLDKFVFATGSSMTTFDFDPAPAPTTVKVTIVKYVDNDPATEGNTNSASFPMHAIFPGGEGDFSLGPVGFNNPNPYQATTADMPVGSNYSAYETLPTSCTGSNSYMLAGYSTGDSLAQAFANASSSVTAPAFTDLQSDKFILVWNKLCALTPQIKVHILKYLNGAEATAISADNYQFPMQSTWMTANLNGGATTSGAYVLGNSHGGASSMYGADTAPMQAPANYLTNEVVGGSSQVVAAAFDCAPGKYVLEGYKVSNTSFADAQTMATTSEVALYGLTQDAYVLVYNKSCPTTATLTVYKNTVGGNGTFSFTGSLGSFQITTTGGTGNQAFTDLTPGTYSVTETPQAGWTQTENTCTNLPLVAGDSVSCTITNTNNAQLGVIRGTKFEDWDADGSPFETKWEEALAGFTIYLDTNNNGVLDNGEQSTVTDSHGVYSFLGLPAGTYHVREVQKAGWTQTYPASGKYTVNLGAGQIAKKKDFGNFKLGVISGMKYNDLNGNHKKGNNEPGLQGWTIKIKSNKGYTASTVTDANGNYSFANLPVGNYTISEVMQNGWKQTDHPNPVKVRSMTVSSGNDFGNRLKSNNGNN